MMRFCSALILLLISPLSSSAFALPYRQHPTSTWTTTSSTTSTALFLSSSTSSTASSAARDLLYQDQQQAMLRRSLVEEELLAPRTSNLELPDLKSVKLVDGGTGFGSKGKGTNKNTKKTTSITTSSRSTTTKQQQRLALQQAKILERDGVVLIDKALPVELAQDLREHVLEQRAFAHQRTQEKPSLARSFYGVEQARAHRCDLQLSLLRGGFAADDNDKCSQSDVQPSSLPRRHVVADALQALLGRQGSVRALYETLVTPAGEFYELAAVVTDPGSHRQTIHPDLPHQPTAAPLYVIFVALQTVTPEMGPTSFLLQTHTAQQNALFTSHDVAVKDAQLRAADCRLSCLQIGQAVVFDARILHCGNANNATTNSGNQSSRALFNFSFRNPAITGSLGYEGSIRPGYCQAMTLADVTKVLDESYDKNNKSIHLDPFAKYGSGLL